MASCVHSWLGLMDRLGQEICFRGKLMLLVTADIPDGIFVTYLSSPNGSFEARTEGTLDRTQGSCLGYLQLDSGGNHYAINDWNPRSAPHQVSLLAMFECMLPVFGSAVGARVMYRLLLCFHTGLVAN